MFILIVVINVYIDCGDEFVALRPKVRTPL